MLILLVKDSRCTAKGLCTEHENQVSVGSCVFLICVHLRDVQKVFSDVPLIFKGFEKCKCDLETELFFQRPVLHNFAQWALEFKMISAPMNTRSPPMSAKRNKVRPPEPFGTIIYLLCSCFYKQYWIRFYIQPIHSGVDPLRITWLTMCSPSHTYLSPIE